MPCVQTTQRWIQTNLHLVSPSKRLPWMQATEMLGPGDGGMQSLCVGQVFWIRSSQRNSKTYSGFSTTIIEKVMWTLCDAHHIIWWNIGKNEHCAFCCFTFVCLARYWYSECSYLIWLPLVMKLNINVWMILQCFSYVIFTPKQSFNVFPLQWHVKQHTFHGNAMQWTAMRCNVM